jgi:hypothetical protein
MKNKKVQILKIGPFRSSWSQKSRDNGNQLTYYQKLSTQNTSKLKEKYKFYIYSKIYKIMEFWPFCDDNRFIFGFTSYPSPITHVCELDSCSLWGVLDSTLSKTELSVFFNRSVFFFLSVHRSFCVLRITLSIKLNNN